MSAVGGIKLALLTERTGLNVDNSRPPPMSALGRADMQRIGLASISLRLDVRFLDDALSQNPVVLEECGELIRRVEDRDEPKICHVALDEGLVGADLNNE